MKITMTNGTRYDGLDDLLRDHEGATGMDARNFFVDLLDADAVCEALKAGRVLVYAEDYDASNDDAIGDIEPTVSVSLVDEPDDDASPYGRCDAGESL